MNPRIGIEADVIHTHGSTVEHLRALMWNTHSTKFRNSNFKANTKASMYDQTAMEGYKKANSFGLRHLNRYITDLYQFKTGYALPPGDVLYYKKQLLHNPLGKYVMDRVYKAEKFFRHQSSFTGNTGDMNNRSHLSTSVLDYSTKVNSENIVTQTKIPGSLYNTIHNMRRTARGLTYRNVAGSLLVDNTLPLVDKNFNARWQQERSGKYGEQAHGQRMVADVNRYVALTPLFEKELIKVKKQPKLKEYVSSFNKGAASGTKEKDSAADKTAKEDDIVYSGCCDSCAQCFAVDCEPGSGLIFDFYLPRELPMGKCVDNAQYTDDWEVYRYLKLMNPFSSVNQKSQAYAGTVANSIAADIETKFQSVIPPTQEETELGIGRGRVRKGSNVNYVSGSVQTDLQGNPYETDQRRAAKIQLGSKPTHLHTVPGAMGHIR